MSSADDVISGVGRSLRLNSGYSANSYSGNIWIRICFPSYGGVRSAMVEGDSGYR